MLSIDLSSWLPSFINHCKHKVNVAPEKPRPFLAAGAPEGVHKKELFLLNMAYVKHRQMCILGKLGCRIMRLLAMVHWNNLGM
jgi:hypothetical protein